MELEAQNDDTNRSKKLKNDRISKISFLDARYHWGLSSDAENSISCPFTGFNFSSMCDFRPIFHVFFLEKSLKKRSKVEFYLKFGINTISMFRSTSQN